ncbi:MAG: sigma-70 family RNA polymerase sigma factor [Actinomycetota bacterium]|nr:sigma-70 family RNA polymerase sigma factor [Actinomycetota bacterium]
MLLVVAGNGDQASFEVLAHEVRPRLRAYALHILRNADDADEVIQEVLLEAWRSAHRYDPSRGRATSWLGQIVRHRSIDLIRRTAARRSREDRVVVRSAVVDVDDTLETVLILADRDSVRAALPGLTDLQREAVSFVYYDGMTITEAARRLGIPVPTMKSRLRDAVRRLRAAVNANGSGSRGGA